MNNSMVRCQECGLWYFNHKKLTKHLIEVHGYVIEIEEDNDEVSKLD